MTNADEASNFLGIVSQADDRVSILITVEVPLSLKSVCKGMRERLHSHFGRYQSSEGAWVIRHDDKVSRFKTAYTWSSVDDNWETVKFQFRQVMAPALDSAHNVCESEVATVYQISGTVVPTNKGE